MIEILNELGNSSMDRPDYVYPHYELEIADNEIINVDLYIEADSTIDSDFESDQQSILWVYRVIDSITKEELPMDTLPDSFKELLSDPNFANELLDELSDDNETFFDEMDY